MIKRSIATSQNLHSVPENGNVQAQNGFCFATENGGTQGQNSAFSVAENGSIQIKNSSCSAADNDSAQVKNSSCSAADNDSAQVKNSTFTENENGNVQAQNGFCFATENGGTQGQNSARFAVGNNTDYLPISPFTHSVLGLNQLNPAVLSFIGDSVQTLFVRTKLAYQSGEKNAALHRMVAAEINATSQSDAIRKILPILSDEEQTMYKRSRNTKTNTSAKNASIIDYRIASGFEGLIGYLYLKGEHDRLNELLALAYKRQD